MPIKSLTVQELKDKLDAGESLTLIDCREQEEWDEGHIKEAIFMPLSTFKENFKNLKVEKGSQIIIQCRSGRRSMSACYILEDNDFTDLYNLEGGILDWEKAGLPVER
ncbi:MAG: rhodanese-like domain-containing protein [Halobacteriovoraceae bacterium]|nr:rhodanese-like domain-containing protein [Halobacteriovoraceae bacterium]